MAMLRMSSRRARRLANERVGSGCGGKKKTQQRGDLGVWRVGFGPGSVLRQTLEAGVLRLRCRFLEIFTIFYELRQFADRETFRIHTPLDEVVPGFCAK